MRLISIFTKKALAATLLILMLTITNDLLASPFRVFWNKFEATIANDNTVVLTWNVTEYNNKNFVVQHSVDGTKWETIAIIQSQNSAESMTDYSYTHKNKLTGKQYYRLKDIDVDISYTSFSPIKTLVLKDDKQVVAIWPNPATDRITIANNNNGDTYTNAKIFNLAGKMMTEKKLESHTNEISINELPAGTYIVKLENNKGTSFNQKIVKQ